MTTFFTLSWGKEKAGLWKPKQVLKYEFSGVCSTDEIGWENGVIDFYPLHFMFPAGTQKVNMLVEGQAEIKMFCKDYVQRGEIMFILSTVACFIVVLSLVHFLMSLAANYAHIRGHDKFTDLKVINTVVNIIFFLILFFFSFQDLYTVDFTSEIIANNQRNPNYVQGWLIVNIEMDNANKTLCRLEISRLQGI